MDESILSGPNMAVVGILTVFVALLLMIFAINVMQRFFVTDNEKSPKRSGAGTATSVSTAGDADTTGTGDKDTLRQVALAAYAFHAAKSVRVPVAAGSSPWQRAGRADQVARRRPRP